MAAEVKIFSFGGGSYTVTINEEDTVGDVKEKLHYECGILPERQTLYCLGYHVDCDDVPFKDLVEMAKDKFQAEDIFSAVFPALALDNDEDLDTDRETFTVLTDPFRTILIEREEWTRLNLSTKNIALLFNTEMGAASGSRMFKALFYQVGDTGLVDIMLLDSENMKKRLWVFKNEDGSTEELESRMEMEHTEENLPHSQKDAFIPAMKRYHQFLLRIRRELQKQENKQDPTSESELGEPPTSTRLFPKETESDATNSKLSSGPAETKMETQVTKDTTSPSESAVDYFNLNLYEKQELLGIGSFGKVFRWKLKDECQVEEKYPLWIAVKELFTHTHEHSHENIVKYLGYARRSYVTYLVMELCETDLRRFKKNRKFTLLEVSVIMKQVIQALDCLRKDNIIHRDIYSGNILVKADEAGTDLKTVSVTDLRFVLCDFGNARYVWDNDFECDMTMSIVGRPMYLPPEVREAFENHNVICHYNISFDIYCAGVVAYELLTGQLPQDDISTMQVDQLQESIGQQCDEVVLDFLQCMLKEDFHKRSSPAQLLSHPFIKQGEQYLQKECKQLYKLSRSKNLDKTEKLKMQLQITTREIARLKELLDQESMHTDLKEENEELIQQIQAITNIQEHVEGLVLPRLAYKEAAFKEDSYLKEKAPTARGPAVALVWPTLIKHQTGTYYARTLNKVEQKKVNDQLWEATRKNDLESINIALSAGAQVNYCKKAFRYGPTTSLHVAAIHGQEAAAELLLKKGADPDKGAGKKRLTPLMYASIFDKLSLAKLLVDNGASVNKKKTDGATALHLAASFGCLSVCKLLVELGNADLYAKDNWGKTPLAKAEEFSDDLGASLVMKYLKEMCKIGESK